jgi:hypothetical protein
VPPWATAAEPRRPQTDPLAVVLANGLGLEEYLGLHPLAQICNSYPSTLVDIFKVGTLLATLTLVQSFA